MSPADQGVGAYPRPFYAWIVVALLFCTAVLSYTDRQVLSLLVDPVRNDLRIGDAQMSLLLGTAFAVIYGIAGIPLGLLADRTSRRNLIFAGVLVWSIGTLLCGFAKNFGALFTARIVVGLGEAVLSPAAISLISDYFPPARRGAAVGLYFTGIAIGVGGSIFIGGAVLHWVNIGLLAGTPLASLAPWRSVFITIGAPSLLWCLLILFIREPLRHGPELSEVQEKPVQFSTLSISGIIMLAPIYLAVAIASFVDNAVGAWSPSLLIRRFKADPAAIGVDLGLLLMVGYGGGMLLGGLLADWARAQRGMRGKIELCLAASLAILPVSCLLNAPNKSAVMLGVPLYFTLSAVVTASGLSTILDQTSNRVRGTAMAVSFFLNVAIGAGFGPVAVSATSDHLFGAAAGLGPVLFFTVAASYTVAAAATIVALFMQRRR